MIINGIVVLLIIGWVYIKKFFSLIMVVIITLTMPTAASAVDTNEKYDSTDVKSYKDSPAYLGSNTEYDTAISEYDIYLDIKSHKNNGS